MTLLSAQLAVTPGKSVRVRQTLLLLVGGFMIFAASDGCSVSNTDEPNHAAAEKASQMVKSVPSPPLDDECEVIQDLIDQFAIPICRVAASPQSLLIIQSASNGDWISEFARSDGVQKGAGSEMLNAYVEANKLPREWPTTLQLSRDYHMLSENWEFSRIQERFPRANEIISISRPGFSSDRQRAMVFLDVHSGPFSGAGFLITMLKTNEGWRLEDLLVSIAS